MDPNQQNNSNAIDTTAPRGPRPPVTRKAVLRLTDPDAPGVVVVVVATDQALPSYSIRIGQPLEGDVPPLPFFNVRVEGQRTGSAYLDQSIDRLFVMLDKAREFIATDAAEKAMLFVDQRREKEVTNMNWGKPQTRKTGKTERERAKKKGTAT